MTFILESDAFHHHEAITERHTGDGCDLSPPLAWSGVPAEAVSLVLLVDDPDSPDPRSPGAPKLIWLVYNLPAETAGLAEGVTARDLPTPAVEGLNDVGRLGYTGPRPDIGRHRYFFRLYALTDWLAIPEAATRSSVDREMTGLITAQTELIGTYRRPE